MGLKHTMAFGCIPDARAGYHGLLLGLLGVMAMPAAAQTAAEAPAPVDSAQQAAPQEGQRAPDTFPVYAIDVTGVTRLSSAEIERIVYRYTGPARTNADMEAARVAIQDAYTQKGYEAVIVALPNQDISLFSQGVITIAVAESPVGEVKVADGKYHSGEAVRRQLASVKPGEPLNLKALQSDLDAANRYPDRQVTPVFVPGKEPGTLDVEFNVESKLPVHVSLELNSDNSPSTTRLRANGTVKYTNLWNAGHTISASVVVAPQKISDSKVFSGSYTAPLLGTPWTLLLYGYKSNSNIAALGGSNVLGNGYQVGVKAIYRLPVTGTSQSLSIGADYKSFKQDILIGGVNAASTPIRYVPLTAEYSLFARDDSSGFAKKIGVSDFGATLGATFGLRAIKRDICASELQNPCIPDDQFQNREVDSIENFVHFNAGLNYSLTTKSDVVLATALSAQVADSHLVTNEQFAAGGLSSVRGYFQSEAVGDNGVTTSLELQAPSLDHFIGKWVDELRVFGFFDAGYVKVKQILPGQTSVFRLAGAGGGARLRVFDTLFGELTLAWPLRDGPETAKGDPRVVFVVRGEF